MDINEIPRGQLSTIILSTLLDGDKYGLEIIDEIEKKTFGELVIKKPSLYSSLSRMEKQDLVSSYWKDSNIGGKRHYYRLTDYGRKQVLQWQNELLASKTKISQILNPEDSPKTQSQTFLQQDDLFALTKPKTEQTLQEKKTEKTVKPSTDFLQYDLFSTVGSPAVETPHISQEPMVFNMKSFEQGQAQEQPTTLQQQPALDTQKQSQETPQPTAKQPKMVQIKHNFDFESAYEKYTKTLSSYAETFQSGKKQSNAYDAFWGSHGVINTVQQIEQNDVPQEQHVSTSFAGSWQEQPKVEHEELPQNQPEPTPAKPQDDAVFITETPPEEVLPKVKKIAPATFNHNLVTPKFKFEKPAQQPSAQVEQAQSIELEKLKQYFASRSIALRPYNQKLTPKYEAQNQTEQTNKSTIAINRYYMFRSLALFLTVAAQCTLLMFILKWCGVFNSATLWMFIFVPTIAFAYFGLCLGVFLKNKTKRIQKQSFVQNPLWYKLIFVGILFVLIYAIHLLAGMNEYNYSNYLATLLLPCLIAVDYIILHFANAIAFRVK